MRIGTWNLAGRWSPDHRALLEDGACDAWLLTEVPPEFDLPGGHLVRSAEMPRTGGRAWAAVWSAAPLSEVAAPHPAVAAAGTGGVVLCSCVLPWRSAAGTWPGPGSNTAGRTIATLAALRPLLTATGAPVVWGGDWNHAMTGRELAGSMEGRRAIQQAVADAGLRVATTSQRHALEGLASIDHVAAPTAWRSAARRVVAAAASRRLSDHDAYVAYLGGP